MTSIGATTGSATIQNCTYGSYDASGIIRGVPDNPTSARTQACTHDDLNRVWTTSGLCGAQN